MLGDCARVTRVQRFSLPGRWPRTVLHKEHVQATMHYGRLSCLFVRERLRRGENMESCKRCAPAIVSDAQCSPPHPPSVVCQRSVSLSIHRNVVGSWSDSPGRRVASMQPGDGPNRVLHARPCECRTKLLPVRPSLFGRCPSIIVRTLSRPYPSVFDVPEIAGPSRPPSRRWMVFILPVTRRRTPHRPKACA